MRLFFKVFIIVFDLVAWFLSINNADTRAPLRAALDSVSVNKLTKKQALHPTIIDLKTSTERRDVPPAPRMALILSLYPDQINLRD